MEPPAFLCAMGEGGKEGKDRKEGKDCEEGISLQKCFFRMLEEFTMGLEFLASLWIRNFCKRSVVCIKKVINC